MGWGKKGRPLPAVGWAFSFPEFRRGVGPARAARASPNGPLSPRQVRYWALLKGRGAGTCAGTGLAWAAAGTVIPGILGALGACWAAVLAVPVPLRQLPDACRPAPSCLASRPGPLSPRPHPPQLLLLPLQCSRLPVCLCLLRLLEQRGLFFLPRLLPGTGHWLRAGLCGGCTAAEAAG